MNVFEDLIVELKEENLLENTVINAEQKSSSNPRDSELAGTVALEDQANEVDAAPADEEPDEPQIELIETDEDADSQRGPVKTQNPRSGKEYFKKQGLDEVSSLQMVDHILTGVERENMKVVPRGFDDFNAKKALNNFLNAADDVGSEAHKDAEYALRKETEAWGLSLIERDKNVAVPHIRQYCENSKPALSSQAMLALARFYRNAPYSESVRSKFDFVITRLFSIPVDFDQRVCLFDRDAMLGHIKTLYSEWSSVPLYDADTDESNVLLTGLSFEDLALEAERASKFDQLIESDFFGRLRQFKESISELFFAPTVTAAAIESNIRVGNAYVNLIVRERQKMDSASIQIKYGEFNDQSVSDAAGRSLDLVELLNGLTDEVIKAREAKPQPDEEGPTVTVTLEKSQVEPSISAISKLSQQSPVAARLIENARNVNKWLLGVGFLLLLLSGGLYIWGSYIVDDKVSTAGVDNVELDSSLLAEHIKVARISHETLYCLLLPTWDTLSKEKREDYLQKVYQLGPTKGYKQVDFINKDGKSAGFASAARVEVNTP